MLTESFVENAPGTAFTVDVNHLKSKGSACLPDDPDIGDGQGNCNVARTKAAQAIVDFLATDPTGSGESDFPIIGDLKSYTQSGYLDQGLSSGTMTPQVTGVAFWHVNADEPSGVGRQQLQSAPGCTSQTSSGRPTTTRSSSGSICTRR